MTVTVTAGRLSLAGTALSDDSGALVLIGGRAGGVLTGSGTVDVKVTNGGWVEPSPAGLVLTGECVRTVQGSLVLPAGPGGGATLSLQSGDYATIAGSLFISGTPCPLIRLARGAIGVFRRVRVIDDNHRLSVAYPAEDGTITGTVAQARSIQPTGGPRSTSRICSTTPRSPSSVPAAVIQVSASR